MPPAATIDDAPERLGHILAIDDDPVILMTYQATLRKAGFRVSQAMSGSEALEVLAEDPPDLILLDVCMADMDGFDTFHALRQATDGVPIPVIFASATEDMENIERVFDVGGSDYLSKPLRDFELIARVNTQIKLRLQALEIRDVRAEAESLRRSLLSDTLDRPEVFRPVITVSPQMRSIFQYISAVSATPRPILITGETGTGKELIARCVHDLSGRTGEHVAVNVAGLDDNLFTDTLFGHVKGAYTGADRPRAGLIEQAAGGTLFLDEIGDLGPISQVKLLRLLQEREYYPLGSDERKISDARIVVATQSPLAEMIESGQFRRDLYYRLSTHHVHIPPLRERRCDIPVLLHHFLRDTARQLGIEPPTPSDELMGLLHTYDFPGNVRELEAMLFDAISRQRGPVLAPTDFKVFQRSRTDPASTISGSTGPTTQLSQFLMAAGRVGNFPSLKDTSEILIETALEISNGNQATAASLLGMTRQALNKRLKRRDDD